MNAPVTDLDLTRRRIAREDGRETKRVGGERMAIPLDPGLGEPLVTAGDSEDAAASSAPTENIQQGRSLALVDFQPPEISAGERLIRIAYRLGVPGNTLAAPFRKPARPRLLATVESPLPGNRVAGMALRAGHFLINGVKAPIAQMDFSPIAKLVPPVERVVHGFTWLRDLDCCAPRPQCTSTAERVLANWLEHNPHPGKGPAWKVENAGLRLLGWLVHAPLLLAGEDKALRDRKSVV